MRNNFNLCIKYSWGYRLTSITRGLSLSHLLWTANTEKETERWFTLPLASVWSAAMSAVQLPQPCCSVGLTAPHVLPALFSLIVKTHGCLKSLLNELKLSFALLTGLGPGLKCDVSGKGGIPESKLSGSAVPQQWGEAFKRAFAPWIPEGWGPLTEPFTSKGSWSCRRLLQTCQICTGNAGETLWDRYKSKWIRK